MKKTILISFLTLFFATSATVQTFAATLFTDKFSGTSGTDLNTYSSNYQEASGAYALQGDGSIFGGDNTNDDVYYAGTTYANQKDQCLSVDANFQNSVQWYELWLRNNQDPSAFQDYRLTLQIATASNTISNFDAWLNRGGVNVTQAGLSVSAGWHNIKFCAIGTTLTGYIDGA